MKFCNRLFKAITFEPDHITPCCLWLPIKYPCFPLAQDGTFDLKKYEAWLHEVVLAMNEPGALLCRGCYESIDVDELPDLTLSINFLSINMHRNLCNCRCSYCELWELPKMPAYRALPQIQYLAGNGKLRPDCIVEWGGGEPTLLKEFPETVFWLLKNKIFQSFYTNASRFSPAILETIRQDMGVMTSSLDCGTPATYRAVRGRDLFSRVVGNLEKYCAAHPAGVIIKYIIMRENISSEEIDAFVEIARRLRPGKVFFTLRGPVPRWTKADVYKAAVYFSETCKRAALSVQPTRLTRSHLDVIKKAAKYELVDVPHVTWPNAPERPYGNLFGSAGKNDAPLFRIGTVEEYQNSLQEAGKCVFDYSPRYVADGFFFTPPSATDCSQEEYQRRLAMIRLRPLVAEEDMAHLAAMDAARLHDEYRVRLAAAYESSLRARADALRERAGALKGRAVYFWGCGAAYAHYKHLFSATSPRAILVNLIPESGLPANVDGIPVRFAQDVLCDGEVLPIIVFAREEHVDWIVHAIERFHPAHGGDNITLCVLFDDNRDEILASFVQG